ncbi:MAG TPA: hypothetical protein VEO96_10775 [Thermoplasmata archaeon]|nr:hypothetical protein [Thermoplasmata archaeon]
MDDLIGASCLDRPVPFGVAPKPRDPERFRHADLSPEWVPRIVPPKRPARDGKPRHQDSVREWGLLQRLARAVVTIL